MEETKRPNTGIEGRHRGYRGRTVCSLPAASKDGFGSTIHFGKASDRCSLRMELLSGTAYVPGAVSVLNSYATGKGVAFGIGLGQTVEVSLTPTSTCGDVTVLSSYHSDRGASLVRECVRKTLALGDSGNCFDTRVTVSSNLPIARGLKSSSALANATVLAVTNAIGADLSLGQMMSIARAAEIKAGVSTFGSIDDGWATALGGVVCADSESRRVLWRHSPQDALDAVILAPSESARHIATGARESLRSFKKEMTELCAMASRGDVFQPMTINAIVHARQFGYDASVIFAALAFGAKGVALSGKGPAYVALTARTETNKVIGAWRKYGHEILVTGIDNRGAVVRNAEGDRMRKEA